MLLYLGLLVLVTTVFCELAANKGWLPYWVSRKILHIVAVGSCAVAGYYANALGHRELLTWIVAGAEIILLGLIGFGGLMREESGRKPWGIVWFPLAFLVLLLLVQSAEIIGFSMAVLAVCDPAATIAGKLFRFTGKDHDVLDNNMVKSKTLFWQTYQLTGDPKSLQGSAAFLFCFGILAFLIPTSFYYGADAIVGFPEYLHDFYQIHTLLLFGIILTAGEALGSKGLDNFIVPLLAAALLNIRRFQYYPEPALILLITCVCAALFAYAAQRRRSLSAGGAVTASVLGILIVHAAGGWWLAPLFLFFLSSSLIGKLFPSATSSVDEKHQKPRDATQVIANGGAYLLLIIAYAPSDVVPSFWNVNYPLLLLITAATATADTWSSELGQYFRRPTWDLLKGRRVPTGLSGGVSFPGTLAGLGGSALIACLGFWLLPEPSLKSVLVITGFGFGGMLLDSVLGSLLQATYRDPKTGALSDVRPEGGELASGFPWMTNDLVNFLAILGTVGLAVLVIQ